MEFMNVLSTTYDREISRAKEAGETRSELADAIGVSENDVRRASSRRGIYLPTEASRSLRNRVESMKPLEAIEYLLGVVEELSLVKSAYDHPVDAWGVHLTRKERRLLVALHDANGAVLNKDALFSALYFDARDADDLPEVKIIDVFVCKIRRKLPAAIGEIVTAWGYGYAFYLPKGSDDA